MSVNKTANVNVRIQENVKQQAEEILDSMGISRATAIDMFYRQIIFNNGIPFPLKAPKNMPTKENMDEEAFNSLMANGYAQAIQGDTYSIDEVFEELERGL
ncbi:MULTISPECIES: type II toxin-antitoxin system RelB/DinJ family antitoxin [unclassified Staphylococcus]|uniref:type II toxin-antitoxin system RelB/DinJ family antitoxin n=1 Tax=unclassified Staphylococcus TaxID=91994 RepID=UPI0021D31614|nr:MULTISPECIES: type II toxin-antitoxin system RelB/DinJ family antitoxin [unclassified Staphylococcus]UXR77754.1 type II toxin-antitoxin system RelB/DinJ family antitoxin [Staphylococcus sp. IVB6227]UXR81913.1 type II toxin-antitoxin system RelB/DinJ family antitoxin [Staphylococcus sp. IVB6214]